MLRTCRILATWLVLALVLLRLILTALLRTFGGKTKFWIPKSVTFLDPDTSNICNTFLSPWTKSQISDAVGYLNQWTVLTNDLHHVVVANVAK